MKFSLENAEFYEDFADKVFDYSETIYQVSLNIKNIKKYNSYEIANILLINTIVFENIYAFKKLVYDKLIHSALSCFRSFMENYRLLLWMLQNEKFLKEYCENENLEFRTVRDQEFLQARIIKEMTETVNGAIKEASGWEYHNKKYIKNSPFSEIHSELSKVAHLTNTNLMMLLNLEKVENKNRIYLGVGVSELNKFSQSYIIKLFELLYITLADYNIILKEILSLENVDESVLKESIEIFKELTEMYNIFIKLRYKEAAY